MTNKALLKEINKARFKGIAWIMPMRQGMRNVVD